MSLKMGPTLVKQAWQRAAHTPPPKGGVWGVLSQICSIYIYMRGSKTLLLSALWRSRPYFSEKVPVEHTGPREKSIGYIVCFRV